MERKSIFRVGGALLLGAVLIGSAFYIEHRGIAERNAASMPALVATNDTVRSIQSTSDTDNDGTPDWEEELRGSDPFLYSTFETATTTEDVEEESYAPPTTVTDKFAETFFEDLMRTGAGKEMSAEEKAALIKRSTEALVDNTKDVLYTRAQMNIVDRNDLSTLREYGNAVSAAIEKHSAPKEHEMVILQRAIEMNDPETLALLAPIEQGYKSMINEMLYIAVPTVIAKEHVDLVNTLSMVHADITSMQQVFADPLPALVRVQRYEEDAVGLLYALDNLRGVLEANNVAYTNSEPGMFLFSLRP